MNRISLEASAFVLPLDGIDAHAVAAAMHAGTDLHEADGAVWSAQGMAAVLALREHAEVIICTGNAALAEVLLGWGLGVTDQALGVMLHVGRIIETAPLMLTEAAALLALRVRR